MKTSAVIIVALALMTLAGTSRARPLTEPSYSSDRPLYAKIVLDEEATRILTLALDESGGTGKGYDTLYADLNLNGDLTDDKETKGQLIKKDSRRGCSFPPVELDVPPHEGGTGGRGHWQFSLNYYTVGTPAPGSEPRPPTTVRFNLQAKLRLRDGAGEWEYTFDARLFPVAEREGVLAALLIEKPFLFLRVGQDAKDKNKTGIAAYVIAGGEQVGCKKTDKPITARVAIKDDKGNIVRSEDVRLDQMFFG